MNELLRKIRNTIERMVRDGNSESDIQNAIKRIVSQNPASDVFPDIRTMNAEDFIKNFSATEAQQEVISSRIAPIIKLAEKASKSYQENVFVAVQNGLKQAAKKGLEGDFREFARETLKGTTQKVHHVETQILTAAAALDRASNIEAERLAGGEWFRYVGPVGGARSFCAQHVGRVYHISEILAMDNGQGLSVLYHCGGWHCRHQWVGVSVVVARLERADWFAKAA